MANAPICGMTVDEVVTSFLLELLIYPCIFTVRKWNFEVKRQRLPQP